MNKNHIRGRCDGASWHNTAKPVGLAVEVNAAVVRRRTASLPGEISTARGRESGSAVRSNALGDGREPKRSGGSLPAKRCRQLSRGHSSGNANRGAETRPCKRRNPRARSVKDRTESMVRPGLPPAPTSPALAVGASSGNRSGAETERPCASAAVPQGEAADVRHPRVT